MNPKSDDRPVNGRSAFADQFALPQKERLERIAERMEERYGASVPTAKMSGWDFFWNLGSELKKRWYWFLIPPTLILGFMVAWYVCTGLLFFILLGMLVSYMVYTGSSLWFIDMNAKGQITPISVGRTAYAEMKKAEDPINPHTSKKGDLVLMTWDFQPHKPVKFAEDMLRDPWGSLYDLRRIDWQGKKLKKLMEHELTLFADEEILGLQKQREFAKDFIPMWRGLKLPKIEQARKERELQEGFGDVVEHLRTEESDDLSGGGGFGG